ncbi:MAG: cytochrome c [Rhodocyclaceae bacterium]
MNKRQARLFAIASTGIATFVFLALTVHSHTQFATLTHAQNITPEVTRGKNVWHANNCINCHTLFGEGAYYAPDLTKITQHRGAAYLTAYLRDPAQFYDEQRHRRLMPKQNLSDQDIAALIAFLDWVSKVDNQGWPPRPILVTGSTLPGTDMSIAQQVASTSPTAPKAAEGQPPAARPVTAAENPIARGQALFRSASPACNACHSISPGVTMAGPSLAGVATRAQSLIGSPDYHGGAKSAHDYIRESIEHPSAHLVAGAMFSAKGVSFMPDTYAAQLKPEQIEDLVAYLGSLN